MFRFIVLFFAISNKFSFGANIDQKSIFFEKFPLETQNEILKKCDLKILSCISRTGKHLKEVSNKIIESDEIGVDSIIKELDQIAQFSKSKLNFLLKIKLNLQKKLLDKITEKNLKEIEKILLKNEIDISLKNEDYYFKNIIFSSFLAMYYTNVDYINVVSKEAVLKAVKNAAEKIANLETEHLRKDYALATSLYSNLQKDNAKFSANKAARVSRLSTAEKVTHNLIKKNNWISYLEAASKNNYSTYVSDKDEVSNKLETILITLNTLDTDQLGKDAYQLSKIITLSLLLKENSEFFKNSFFDVYKETIENDESSTQVEIDADFITEFSAGKLSNNEWIMNLINFLNKSKPVVNEFFKKIKLQSVILQ